MTARKLLQRFALAGFRMMDVDKEIAATDGEKGRRPALPLPLYLVHHFFGAKNRKLDKPLRQSGSLPQNGRRGMELAVHIGYLRR
ncbi:hypothetical protein D3C84_953300 [compost metagenome]